MPEKRLSLHSLFERAAEPYNAHVYFQPPSKMEFPAIRYKKAKIENGFADERWQ